MALVIILALQIEITKSNGLSIRKDVAIALSKFIYLK